MNSPVNCNQKVAPLKFSLSAGDELLRASLSHGNLSPELCGGETMAYCICMPTALYFPPSLSPLLPLSLLNSLSLSLPLPIPSPPSLSLPLSLVYITHTLYTSLLSYQFPLVWFWEWLKLLSLASTSLNHLDKTLQPLAL